MGSYLRILVLMLLCIASINSIKATVYYTISTSQFSFSQGGSNCGCSPDYTNDTVYFYHNRTFSSNTTFTNSHLYVMGTVTLKFQNDKTYNFNSNCYLEVGPNATLELDEAKFYFNSGTAAINGAFKSKSDKDDLVNAGTMSFFTFDADDKIDIVNSGTISVSSTFTIDEDFDLTNTGSITLNGNVKFDKKADIINDGASASLIINGNLDADEDFTLDNDGDFIVNGTANFDKKVDFTNNSGGDIQFTSTLDIKKDVEIVNSGSFSVTGAADLDEKLTIDNNSGGSITFSGNLDIKKDADFTNDGDISLNTVHFDKKFDLDNNASGNITFNGTVTADDDVDFINDGNITFEAEFTADKDFDLDNNTSGVVIVNGSLTIDDANIDNDGSISGLGVIDYDSGTFTNTSPGTINGYTGSVASPLVLAAYPQDGNTADWTIYDGSYSNGTPSCSKNLLLKGNLAVGSSQSAKRLAITKGITLTVQAGQTLEVCDLIANEGTIVIEHGASLIQTGSGTNTGEGTYYIERDMAGTSTAVNFVSSPIVACSTSVMNSNPCDVYMWDPVIQYYSFDYPSGYVGNCNGVSVTFSGVYSQADGDFIMNPGRGYGAKNGTFTTKEFLGAVNNGDIDIEIKTSGLNNAVGWSGDDWNLIGNPYPSALDLDEFLTVNAASITGGAYIWDDDATGGTGYSSSDYFVYNISGSSTSPNSSKSFDGKLNLGAAFWVQANDVDAPGGETYTIHFTNDMRTGDGNNDDFRMANTAQRNRIWLELKDDTTFLSSTLVAFLEDASDAFDNQFDAKRAAGGNPYFINSMLDNEAMVIQGLGKIENYHTKTVGLQVVVPASGVYSIYCPKLELANVNYKYTLIDTQENVRLPLDETIGYDFAASTSGTIDNRFYLEVTNTGMPKVDEYETVRVSMNDSTPNQDTTTAIVNVVAENSFNAFAFQSTLHYRSTIDMSNVSVIDLTGKEVAQFRLSKSVGNIETNLSAGVYIARFTATNGAQFTQKIVLTRP